MNDPISDMLSRIRNANRALLPAIELPHSKMKESIAGILKRVSRPGLRRYVGSTEIPRVLSGMGISIVSTPEGVMTGAQAKKKNLGGELLCNIW